MHGLQKMHINMVLYFHIPKKISITSMNLGTGDLLERVWHSDCMMKINIFMTSCNVKLINILFPYLINRK